MISLTIWVCLWSIFFVLAPPLSSYNQSPEKFTFINSSSLSNTNPKILIKRRKMKPNRTRTEISSYNFDINSYRSSWKFIDKNTIRVRFRLYESLLNSILSTRFLVRHLHSGHIRTYDEPHEIINSTLTLYLHNIKHGRHIVCLLLYRTKLMLTPKHIFCQDIIFNFQKYGHHDMDLDEYGNTFVFLLTQYSIVIGILCILQLVYAARKRRFLRMVYDKANALRTHMTEYHHRKPTTTDLNHPTHALEYLIYNLNRNALFNIDQRYLQPTNEDEINDSPGSNEKYLKIPNSRLSRHSITPLIGHNRLLVSTNNDNSDFDESDFDTRSYEEQSVSFKSVSHILEENKPWMTKLADDGSIKHSILLSQPVQLQNTQLHSL